MLKNLLPQALALEGFLNFLRYTKELIFTYVLESLTFYYKLVECVGWTLPIWID